MPNFFSQDTYPGEAPKTRDAHPADEFIYRHMRSLIVNRGDGESTADPNSSVAHGAAVLMEKLQYVGVDLQRIRVGFAVTQMDLGRQIVDLHGLEPEDFGAEA